MVKVSPSIIAIDYKNEETLLENLRKVEKAGASLVHLDVMDGKFVKNTTFDDELVEFVKDNTTLLLDVHLMVENPENHIQKYVDAGADVISFHIESTSDPMKVVQKIKDNNVICGVAINPTTPLSKIKELIDNNAIDLVLLMSVEPGEYGQPFLPESFQKLAELREMSREIDIEVDGGVNLKNAKVLRKLGANILVSGSTIFSSKNIKKTVRQLKGSCLRFIGRGQ